MLAENYLLILFFLRQDFQGNNCSPPLVHVVSLLTGIGYGDRVYGRWRRGHSRRGRKSKQTLQQTARKKKRAKKNERPVYSSIENFLFSFLAALILRRPFFHIQSLLLPQLSSRQSTSAHFSTTTSVIKFCGWGTIKLASDGYIERCILRLRKFELQARMSNNQSFECVRKIGQILENCSENTLYAATIRNLKQKFSVKIICRYYS